MKKFLNYLLLGGCLMAMLLLVACGPQEKELTGADQEAVLAFSESATENMFAGLTAGDYAAFSRDFDKDMLAGIPEANFQQNLTAKIGNYVSREVVKVSQVGNYYVVVYQAKFELDDPVTVRVVFSISDPHNISGLWFDSAKLREK